MSTSSPNPPRVLSKQQRQIISQINSMHFPNFKQNKLNYYNALIKCGINMNNEQLYQTCTESVLNQQAKAEQVMKSELETYEKQYQRQLARCVGKGAECTVDVQSGMRKEVFQIFGRYYSTSFLE